MLKSEGRIQFTVNSFHLEAKIKTARMVTIAVDQS